MSVNESLSEELDKSYDSSDLADTIILNVVENTNEELDQATKLVLFNAAESYLIDNVYPDRVEYLKELNKVLNIEVINSKIIVNSIKKQIRFCDNFIATDIRGGMSCLILASYLTKKYSHRF